MPFSPEHRTSTGDGDNTFHTDTVVDVFERFKNYLDEKVESLSSSLVSRTATETQKLSIVLAVSLYFTGKCLHSACLYLVVVCFMRQHTGEGKLFSFVRTQ